MNKFDEHELQLAIALKVVATQQACTYSGYEDLHAATIAVLILALELAGGKHFLKPQDENE